MIDYSISVKSSKPGTKKADIQETSAWNRTAKLLSFNFPKASTALRDYNRALMLEHPRINSINFFNFPQKHNNRNLNQEYNYSEK